MNGPIEFGQDMTQDYLASQLNPIETEEQDRIGQARAQGAARGLEGQAQAGAMESGARDWAGTAKNKTISDFNMSLAGMNRDERLRNQGEQWHLQDQAYQSSEAEKDRAFREKLMERGFDQEANMGRAQFIRGQQNMVGSAGLSAIFGN